MAAQTRSGSMLERYARQLGLIGVEGQERLAESTVLVAGVGGVGSAAALYLAAAGVGRLILVDRDAVEESNLNRQVLYEEGDVGRSKVRVAAERLRRLNPDIRVEPYELDVRSEAIEALVEEADVVLDCLDNWESRLRLDECAWRHAKPLVHGGVDGWSGVVTVVLPGSTPCLRCIAAGLGGGRRRSVSVVGVAAGLVGVLVAAEALKLLLGVGRVAAGKLLFVDLLSLAFEEVEVVYGDECRRVCGEPG